ncbi:MAG: GGDEF domain-containing protein [Acidimicrobiia bacterium]|nr:GGDEF domain-containing protein [Acidimicrobiia bacterium]
MVEATELDDAAIVRATSVLATAVLVMDDATRILWANRSAESTFAPPGGTVVGTSAIDYVHPDDLGLAVAATELLASIDPDRFEQEGTIPAVYRLRTGDGSYGTFEIDGRLARGLNPADPDAVLTVTAVNNASRLESVTTIIGHIAAGDPSARTVATLVAANTSEQPVRLAAVTWTDDDGARRTELGLVPGELAESDHPDDPWNRAAATGEPILVRFDDLRPELRPVAEGAGVAVCVAVAVPDPGGGDPACIIGWAPTEHTASTVLVRVQRSMVPLLTLALERRHHLRRLTQAATRDALTGLHNRRELLDRLAAMHEAGECPTLLFCDLDGFKEVNDTYGHAAGDQVLAAVADRLVAATRGTDVTARLGGDEFAVVLTDGGDPEVATTLADRVLSALAEPIGCRTDGGVVEVRVGASIGIAIPGPGGTVTPKELLVAADAAMYQAKRAGTNRHHIVELAADATPA